MNLQEWTTNFLHNYLLRTGMTWDDGGGTNEELQIYFDRGYTPEQAVTNEIEKYGLLEMDISNDW